MLKPHEQRFPWNLDWNLLRTFMMVVEAGGITPAAHLLRLRQPTIRAFAGLKFAVLRPIS